MYKEIEYPEQERPHPAFQVHKVLDAGFVRLVDCMPSPTDPHSISADAAIVQAARTSYGKGTKAVNEDSGLINYLMKHRHTTPFEMVEFKFHCRMPIFIARQWIRHRTASVNEYSARYSEVRDLSYIPDSASVMGQSKGNKQASEGELDQSVINGFIGRLQTVSQETYSDYQEFLEKGVSRETARMLLPINFYTEWYWKVNLHNLFNFLSLRADSHAQREIMLYAEKMLEVCREIAPIATNSFENHRKNAVTFSSEELEILRSIIVEDPNLIKSKIVSKVSERGWSKRKQEEFIKNIAKIVKELK